MILGSRVRVGGWIWAVSLPERWYGCRNAGFSPNSPIILLPDRFRVKPYPSKQKKVGENLPLQDKSAWACLLGKMVHFWEPWKQAFWPSPEYREPPICSQGIPCQVLWSGMLRLGRGGQQQLRLKNHQALVSPQTDSTSNAR